MCAPSARVREEAWGEGRVISDLPLTRRLRRRPLPARGERWSDRLVSGLVAMILLSGPALAQTPAPDACSTYAWPVIDVQKALAADVAKIASGSAAPQDFVLSLTSTEQVPFPTKPERAPKKSGTFGGFVTLDPPKAKLLQVTLSEDAWIDVVQGGTIVKSGAFSGKSGCDGVRKSLRFTLTGTGPVTLQVSGADAPAIKIDVRGVE